MMRDRGADSWWCVNSQGGMKSLVRSLSILTQITCGSLQRGCLCYSWCLPGILLLNSHRQSHFTCVFMRRHRDCHLRDLVGVYDSWLTSLPTSCQLSYIITALRYCATLLCTLITTFRMVLPLPLKLAVRGSDRHQSTLDL